MANNPTFKESFIHAKKEVKTRNPLLVLGLPGVGLVSKLAVDHATKTLDASRIASLYSPAFFNQVVAMKNGKLRPFTLRFYHAPNSKRDLVIVRGDLQPLTVEGQYEVTAKLLDYYTRVLGGKEVFAMAGYAVNRKVEKPQIYAAATHKAMFQKLSKMGVKPSQNHVPIVGMAGLVPGLAPLFGGTGATILVETPGNSVDAHGATKLLDFLSAYTGHKIDTKELEKRAKKAEEMLRRAEAQQTAETARAGGAKADEVLKKETLSYIR